MADIDLIVCVAFDHRADAEGLKNFKHCIERCHFVKSTMQVSGTYDMIVQGSCTSLAEYEEQMENIRPQVAAFATRLETNFISKVLVHNAMEERDDTLWLPCESGQRQVQARLINKIEAERDYMRVYTTNWTCLVHATMTRLTERLRDSGFVRLNRSSLVRVAFIERVIHKGHRWTALLCDGTCMNVARNEVRPLMKLMMACRADA